MATGAGLGGLISALLPLVGLVTIFKGRSRRKRGLPEEPVDDSVEKRRAASQESERRMAAYLASRDQRNWRDDGE